VQAVREPLMSTCVRRRRRRVNLIVRLAGRLRADTARLARGRCLALSLELCRQAQAQGIALRLVVWSVAGDPHYCDHWAVLLEDGSVLDLTRVQVDGSPRLIHELHAYPATYRRPRVYPAAGLLPTYERFRCGTRGQLPQAFLYATRWLLLQHDVCDVLKFQGLARVVHSTLSLARFCATQALGAWRTRLLQRRQALQDLGTPQRAVASRLAPPG
jgi:hypothetical protein